MQKQQIWDQSIQYVEKACDKLKKPIDEGIKDTVTILRCFGLSTTASCEGHDDWGHPYPWVDITPENTTTERFNWLLYYEQKKKLIQFIEEFYNYRKPLPYAMIIIHDKASSIRIQSIVGEFGSRMKEYDPNEFPILRKNCTEEMQAFTEFLKEKFWNQ